ncbi:hypothetical protein ACRALDRAFT_1063974, partial [Sodiomyces alcalophilus JCM 7366]|uniref:uncharacterized protein n=1 Tax=Sodiomyces alcalophilus JCM 7366 TaxID=591952 RepID=UPI0039B3E002
MGENLGCRLQCLDRRQKFAAVEKDRPYLSHVGWNGGDDGYDKTQGGHGYVNALLV